MESSKTPVPSDGNTVLKMKAPPKTGMDRHVSRTSRPLRAASNTQSLLSVNVIVIPMTWIAANATGSGTPAAWSRASVDSSAAAVTSDVAMLLARVHTTPTS